MDCVPTIPRAELCLQFYSSQLLLLLDSLRRYFMSALWIVELATKVPAGSLRARFFRLMRRSQWQRHGKKENQFLSGLKHRY